MYRVEFMVRTPPNAGAWRLVRATASKELAEKVAERIRQQEPSAIVRVRGPQ
jgi:hypothetical protein